MENNFSMVEKEMATHSNILAERMLWTEEPGVLQSTGSQRVGHDSETNTALTSKVRLEKRLY